MSAKRTRSGSSEEDGDDSGGGGKAAPNPWGAGSLCDPGGASTGDGHPPQSDPAPDASPYSRGAATLGPTLRSAGLGQSTRCFLCTFTDAALADGSLFADACGPLERVSRYWNEHVETMEAHALSEDCLKLLRKYLSHYNLTTLDVDSDRMSTGESAGRGPTDPEPRGTGAESPRDQREVTRRMTLDDVTPACILTHFTVCATTRAARLSTLKMSFRHVAQLEAACAGSMYSKCSKTGRPHPDPAMSALLLKANAALLKPTSSSAGSKASQTPAMLVRARNQQRVWKLASWQSQVQAGEAQERRSCANSRSAPVAAGFGRCKLSDAMPR